MSSLSSKFTFVFDCQVGLMSFCLQRVKSERGSSIDDIDSCHTKKETYIWLRWFVDDYYRTYGSHYAWAKNMLSISRSSKVVCGTKRWCKTLFTVLWEKANDLESTTGRGEINRLGFHLLLSLWYVNVTCEACGFSSSGKMSDDEWFSSRSSCTLASRDKVHRSPVARFLVSFIRLMSFAYRMLLSDRGRQYLVGLACW